MADEVVRIVSFSAAADAQYFLSVLLEADIAAFLTGEQTAGAFSGILPLGPQIHLFIARADLKRARDLLTDWTWDDEEHPHWGDDAEEGFWPCPSCGDAVPESDAACPSCGTPLEDRPG